MAKDLIANGDFSAGAIGRLPDGWTFRSPRESLAPSFRLARKGGRKVLLAAGNGADDCFGFVSAPATLKAGRTYRLKARFRISQDLNPQLHLRFWCFDSPETRFNDGIFHFRRLRGGLAEGEGRLAAPGDRDVAGEVRIVFCFSPRGRAWIERVSLTPCEPIPPRLVTVAAVEGRGLSLAEWDEVLAAAGREKVDLVLLPETINGQAVETLRGPTATMLRDRARRRRMYAAGGLHLRDAKADRVYNTCLLFDRKGKLAGRYDKVHLYTPELWSPAGPSPGRSVPVFRTDFGTVGVMICYDSWFPDVTQLLALKGAEIVLFPNMGYSRAIMPARANDNCVRIVCSTQHYEAGVWDTAGREVFSENEDSIRAQVPISATAPRTVRRKVGKAELLIATLDLSRSPSSHNWGGPCFSAPGGRRSRREQVGLLQDRIAEEIRRWWTT